MAPVFRFYLFIYLLVQPLICNGQLTITSDPIIDGRPAVIFCKIPNFRDAGEWTPNGIEFSVTKCYSSGICTVVTDGDRYSFSSNTTGTMVTINHVNRSEERTWTCQHIGYSAVTFNINYNENVFVVPTAVTVSGLDQNITLGDSKPTLTLTLRTECMSPRPDLTLYYTNKMNENLPLPNKVDVQSTNGSCIPPEDTYLTQVNVSSDVLCNAEVIPRMMITPEGLPYEYSSTQWAPIFYLNFPACKVSTGLTPGEAFGYSVMFSLIGMVLGGCLVFVIYNILFTKVPLALLVSAQEKKLKFKLYIVSAVLTCLLCMIIAAIVIVTECNETECKDYTIGIAAVFIIPGCVLQVLLVCLVVYLFLKCIVKQDGMVKRLEEEHSDQNTSTYRRRSVSTVTPSAVDVTSSEHYSTNQTSIQTNHFVSSEDFHKTRKFSTKSDSSNDLKTERKNIVTRVDPDKLVMSMETPNGRPDVSKVVHSTNDKNTNGGDNGTVSSEVKTPVKDFVTEEKGNKSKLKTTRIDIDADTFQSNNEFGRQESNRLEEELEDLHSENDSSDGSEESDKEEINQKNADKSNHIWSSPRSASTLYQSNKSSTPTNGHVSNYQSNDQSKVIPDDKVSCIISVPTADANGDIQGTETSTEEEDTLPKGDELTTDKKSSKKKRIKKKRWRKKKQTFAVSPEQTELTDNLEKKKSVKSKTGKKKTSKKKKTKIT